MGHLSDDDLERYYLRLVTNEELERIEEHMLACPQCVELAEAFAEYLDAMNDGLAMRTSI